MSGRQRRGQSHSHGGAADSTGPGSPCDWHLFIIDMVVQMF